MLLHRRFGDRLAKSYIVSGEVCSRTGNDNGVAKIEPIERATRAGNVALGERAFNIGFEHFGARARLQPVDVKSLQVECKSVELCGAQNLNGFRKEKHTEAMRDIKGLKKVPSSPSA